MLERSGIVKHYFRSQGNFLRSPYPLPFEKLKRYIHCPRRFTQNRIRPVTIAAGFKCSDGIVLATDLEITESMTKRISGKSAYFPVQNGFVGIAGAGSYDLLAYACEVIGDNVRGESPRAIIDGLRGNLKRLYREHVHPSYPNDWPTALQLIVGVVFHTEDSLDFGLYVSERNLLRKTGPYEFVGAGKELSYYVMKRLGKDLFRRRQRLGPGDPIEDLFDLPAMDAVVPLSEQLISEVGENVPWCGREADILKIPCFEEPSYVPRGDPSTSGL
jgi:hypothetical protein